MNQGDLPVEELEFMPEEGRGAGRTGVRVLIVARKGRNGSGAKGHRKVDDEGSEGRR